MEDVAARRRRLVRLGWTWLPLFAYAALIFYFSSQPGRDLPGYWFMRYDKVLHAIEYGGLGFLAFRALRRSGVRGRVAAPVAVALALAYGLSDELHQSYVAGRNGNDPGDVAADTVGGALGAAFASLVYDRLAAAAGRALGATAPREAP